MSILIKNGQLLTSSRNILTAEINSDEILEKAENAFQNGVNSIN